MVQLTLQLDIMGPEGTKPSMHSFVADELCELRWLVVRVRALRGGITLALATRDLIKY